MKFELCGNLDMLSYTVLCLLLSESYVPVFPKWGFWAKVLTTPLIVSVGVVGNILSFVVMKSKTLRYKSYSHYLCALAVFDTLTLIFRQVESVDEFYLQHMKSKGLFQNFNDNTCKIYNFFSHVISLMSSWLVVFMALERLIAVCYPFKNVVIRQQTGAVLVICFLFVIVCGSQSFRLVMIEHIVYDELHDIQDCLAGISYIGHYTSLDVYFFQWTLVFVLPVLLISVFNGLVLYRIMKVRKDLQNNDNASNLRYERAVDKKQRSTYMLLVVTFTYVVILLPLFTLSLVVDLTIKLGTLETARKTYRALSPYIDICVSVSLLNYGVNFFIYVLSGRRFRYELRHICFKRMPSRTARTLTVRSTREEFFRV